MPKKKVVKKEKKPKEIDSRLIPEVNIGTFGHVDHGKSTLVEAITGKWPAAHSEELKRGITIRLGYADATIYKCNGCEQFLLTPKCLKCAKKCEPLRTISFVDAPGHETLMATVLASTSLIDGAILLIAADQKCPQPQTKEHLMTLEITGIKNIFIVQNKVDLVSKEDVLKNYKEIKNFVKGTVAENAPIIPISAQQKINIDEVLKAIQKHIPTLIREKGDPKMYVVRSFDVNKPGTEIKKLSGGVIGGALIRGELRVGEEIEIRPGVKIDEKYKTIKTKITGLHKSGKNLEIVGPGGLLGVMTNLDPRLTKSDNMLGNVVGLVDKLPPVLNELSLDINLFENLPTEKDVKIQPLKLGEPLLINVGTARTLGIIKNISKMIELTLKIPICAEKGEKIAISRRIQDRWRLIGHGKII